MPVVLILFYAVFGPFFRRARTELDKTSPPFTAKHYEGWTQEDLTVRILFLQDLYRSLWIEKFFWNNRIWPVITFILCSISFLWGKSHGN